jgi:hypothetical protein
LFPSIGNTIGQLNGWCDYKGGKIKCCGSNKLRLRIEIPRTDIKDYFFELIINKIFLYPQNFVTCLYTVQNQTLHIKQDIIVNFVLFIPVY